MHAQKLVVFNYDTVNMFVTVNSSGQVQRLHSIIQLKKKALFFV